MHRRHFFCDRSLCFFTNTHLSYGRRHVCMPNEDEFSRSCVGANRVFQDWIVAGCTGVARVFLHSGAAACEKRGAVQGSSGNVAIIFQDFHMRSKFPPEAVRQLLFMLQHPWWGVLYRLTSWVSEHHAMYACHTLCESRCLLVHR